MPSGDDEPGLPRGGCSVLSSPPPRRRWRDGRVLAVLADGSCLTWTGPFLRAGSVLGEPVRSCTEDALIPPFLPVRAESADWPAWAGPPPGFGIPGITVAIRVELTASLSVTGRRMDTEPPFYACAWRFRVGQQVTAPVEGDEPVFGRVVIRTDRGRLTGSASVRPVRGEGPRRGRSRTRGPRRRPGSAGAGPRGAALPP